jgi:hypothetical protein
MSVISYQLSGIRESGKRAEEAEEAEGEKTTVNRQLSTVNKRPMTISVLTVVFANAQRIEASVTI